MNNNLFFRITFKIIQSLLLLSPLSLVLSCTKPHNEQTARSGQMTLAVDKQLEDIAGAQVRMFKSYYADAHISLIPVSSKESMRLLLDHKVTAVLIGGAPEAAEERLVAREKSPLRREPVAQDALVCIVNRGNSLRSISLEDLKNIFTGKSVRGIPALATADDFRLQSLFAAITGEKRENLRAWGCDSDSALVLRVSADNSAVGLLFQSSPAMRRLSKNAKSNIRILPVSRESATTQGFLPTQQNIYDGSYPLVSTVYYFYYSRDPLAAGFGAWLRSAGQKAFERSSLAPFQLVERTIILN